MHSNSYNTHRQRDRVMEKEERRKCTFRRFKVLTLLSKYF